VNVYISAVAENFTNHKSVLSVIWFDMPEYTPNDKNHERKNTLYQSQSFYDQYNCC
jgi:hypothetical protein